MNKPPISYVVPNKDELKQLMPNIGMAARTYEDNELYVYTKTGPLDGWHQLIAESDEHCETCSCATYEWAD